MSNTVPPETSQPVTNIGLSQKITDRRQEQEKKSVAQDPDADLHHELREQFERRQNDNANAWRFG